MKKKPHLQNYWKDFFVFAKHDAKKTVAAKKLDFSV